MYRYFVQISTVVMVFLVAFSWVFFAQASTVWQDVTQFRSLNGDFQNTGNTPLHVHILPGLAPGGEAFLLEASTTLFGGAPTDVLDSCQVGSGMGQNRCSLQIVVPPGGHYEAFGDSLLLWSEWQEPESATSTATSTVATTTIDIINNPNQDVFNGLLLFIMVAFGIMWIFRRNK